MVVRKNGNYRSIKGPIQTPLKDWLRLKWDYSVELGVGNFMLTDYTPDTRTGYRTDINSFEYL